MSIASAILRRPMPAGIAAVAVVFFVTSVTQAQTQTPPDEIDRALAALVDDLDHDDFATRRRAASALRRHTCSQSALYAVLESEGLTLEQRHRLIAIAQDRLVDTPRGALGISMRTKRPDPEGPIHIQVIDLLDGMPARDVLQLGDRITAINGRQMLRQEDLRTLVQRHRPGDIVRLDILREKRRADGALMMDENGQPLFDEMRINLPLGAVEDLNRFDNGEAFNNSMVLQERRREAGMLLELYAPIAASVRFR